MNKLVIEKELLKHNVEKIKAFAGTTPVMGIVKCNGYGLGLVEYSKLILEYGIDLLGVSCYEEAIMLKDSGINCEVVLLTSYADEDALKEVVKRDIIATVGSTASAKALENAGVALSKTPRANIEIDTGMGRCGFSTENLDEILSVKDFLIDFCGCFSHFSFSFAKKRDYVDAQLEKFNKAVEYLNEKGFKTGVLHIANSSAFMKYKETHLDMVRVGSALLGRVEGASSFGLKKIGYLETKVIETNTLKKGSNTGYANTYKVKKDTKTAIIPIGYADGFLTEKKRDTYRFFDTLRYIKDALFPGKYYVKINEKPARIIGRVGMFNIICDVTDLNVTAGDTVTAEVNPILLNNSVKKEYR